MKSTLRFILFLSAFFLTSGNAVALDMLSYKLNTTNYTATVTGYTTLDDYLAISPESSEDKYLQLIENITVPATLERYVGGYIDLDTGQSEEGELHTFTVVGIEDEAFEKCLMKTITLPNTITTIGVCAFAECYSLTAITIPNSVTSIGQGAFFECFSLTSITIPNSVTNIEKQLFDGCTGLVSVSIPSSVTIIGELAFWNCQNLKSLEIPLGVKELGEGCFDGCEALESLTIPSGITRIEDGTFAGCSSLKEIIIPSNIEYIGQDVFTGCSSINTLRFDDNQKSIKLSYSVITQNKVRYAKGLFIDCPLTTLYLGRDIEYEAISSEYNTSLYKSPFANITSLNKVEFGNTKTKIEDNLFYECTSLAEVIIPNSITEYGTSAFYRNAITSIDISANIETLKANCLNTESLTRANIRNLKSYFSVPEVNQGTPIVSCNLYYNGEILTELNIPTDMPRVTNIFSISSLKKVSIPASAKNVSIIRDCDALESVTLEDGLTSFKGLRNCKLIESIDVPESVTDVCSFERCKKLNHIKLPSKLTKISKDMFDNCESLKDFTIGAAVDTIGGYAFRNTGITSMVIPDNVTTVGSYAFGACNSLESMTIGKGVKNIPDNLCNGCESLETLTLSSKLVKVGDKAFYNCHMLYNIDLPAMIPPTCGSSVFDGVTKSGCTLNVPVGRIDLYKAADVWKDFFLQEKEFTAIIDIHSDNTGQNNKYYLINGTYSSSLQKGLNIIIDKNGNCKKVIGK